MRKNDIVQNVWICKANSYFSTDFFGCYLSNVNRLKCISMNNQEYKVRPQIVVVKSDESVFFLFYY